MAGDVGRDEFTARCSDGLENAQIAFERRVLPDFQDLSPYGLGRIDRPDHAAQNYQKSKTNSHFLGIQAGGYRCVPTNPSLDLAQKGVGLAFSAG
jgi:hypothetical protein